MTTAIQIASRLFILWGVLYMYPEVKVNGMFVNMMFISWCLADITRYLFYFLNTFTRAPFFLTFLRYNLFLLLYPTGILVKYFFPYLTILLKGEVTLLWHSLAYASRRPWISFPLPNALNFGFNTYELYCILLLTYIPCSPIMYGHMLAQRRKVMGQKKKTA